MMKPRVQQHGAARKRKSLGFSLVEIMVAALIGMIGSIVIFQVFSVFEGQKRTTTGAGDAQQNGLLALFSIEREARMAGYGITYEPLLGCTVQVYDAGPPIRNFNFTLAPLIITNGAGTAPDTITFVYGNSPLLQVPAKLITASAAAGTTFRVDNRFGFGLGDVVIAGEVGKNCGMAQVTALPNAVGQTSDIGHTAGTYVNAQGNTVNSRYNPAAGIGIAYNVWDNTSLSGGRVYSLGTGPSVVTYSLSNNQLMMRNTINADTFFQVVDGVVQLQAEYGRDTNDDNIVDTWSATLPGIPTAIDWRRIIAMRIAVVTRSSQPDRPNPATGVCTATTASPTWVGGTLDITADADWRCYRYRVFETVVPIRNMIWKPS